MPGWLDNISVKSDWKNEEAPEKKQGQAVKKRRRKSELVRRAIEKFGSKAAFAVAIGCSPDMAGRVTLANRPDLHRRVKTCRALECRPEQLGWYITEMEMELWLRGCRTTTDIGRYMQYARNYISPVIRGKKPVADIAKQKMAAKLGREKEDFWDADGRIKPVSDSTLRKQEANYQQK